MSKFKVGDKVKRTAPSEILEVGGVYTVEYVAGATIKVCGYGTGFAADCFELVIGNETIRKQITDAVNMLEHFKIWRNMHGYIGEGKSHQGYPLNVFLDKFYPIKTPQQLEIESIRKEQEKLAEYSEAKAKLLEQKAKIESL